MAFTVFLLFARVVRFPQRLSRPKFRLSGLSVFVLHLHHHQPENRPVREPVSAPRRFSCRSFAPSPYSVAFALFSVFSLQVLFLFDLTLFFFSRLVLFPLRPALAPLAFSLRLSIRGIFPFLVYINELTLSTLFRDKNDVPKLFLLLAWHISLSSNLFSRYRSAKILLCAPAFPMRRISAPRFKPYIFRFIKRGFTSV